MRIKRDDDRDTATRVSLRLDAVEDLLVTTVDTVKISEGGDRAGPTRRRVGRKMRYVHATC